MKKIPVFRPIQLSTEPSPFDIETDVWVVAVPGAENIERIEVSVVDRQGSQTPLGVGPSVPGLTLEKLLAPYSAFL